jgi:nucleoside-diphosphate-sugar epimerase
LARFVEKAKVEGVINITGGHQVLGRIDVRDVVDAFMNVVADNTYNNADIYNLGMSENVSLVELANIISKKVSEKKGETVSIVVTPNQDTKSHAVDSSKFNKKFNWQAKYSLEEIVSNLLFINEDRKMNYVADPASTIIANTQNNYASAPVLFQSEQQLPKVDAKLKKTT